MTAPVPAVSRRTRIERTDWTLCVDRAARKAPAVTVDSRGKESLRYPMWESRYDVYIRHVDGTRIPMGPNLFTEPSSEEARLLRMVDPLPFVGPYQCRDGLSHMDAAAMQDAERRQERRRESATSQRGERAHRVTR